MLNFPYLYLCWFSYDKNKSIDQKKKEKSKADFHDDNKWERNNDWHDISIKQIMIWN
jgi:hypothetical protein